MPLYQSVCRISKRRARGDILRAVIVTAFVPATAATLFLWQVPEGCGVWVNHSRHRWTCLLPGLLLFIPIITAILMTIFTVFNQRLERPVPNGWLVSTLSFGMVTHIIFLVGYALALGPGYFDSFLTQAIFIPQLFLAGVIAASVYWIALYWRN